MGNVVLDTDLEAKLSRLEKQPTPNLSLGEGSNVGWLVETVGIEPTSAAA